MKNLCIILSCLVTLSASIKAGTQAQLSQPKPSSVPHNLILNPSFEQVLPNGATSHFSGDILRSEDSVHGDYSACLKRSGSHGEFVSQKGILLQPNTCYRLSASLKCITDTLIPKKVAYGLYSEGVMVILFTDKSSWAERPATVLLRGGTQDWTRLTEYFKTGSAPLTCWLGLYVLGTKGMGFFDHLELVACSEQEYLAKKGGNTRYSLSPRENLVYNGSFEITSNPDVPDGSYSQIGDAWYKKDPRPWGTQLSLSHQGSPHGKNHLILSNHSYLTYPSNPLKKELVTLSFMGKSQEKSGWVQVFWGSFHKRFALTDQWQRYTATFEAPTRRSQLGFTNSQTAAIALDCLMINVGEKAMPYAKSERELCHEYAWNYQRTPFFGSQQKPLHTGGEEILIKGKPETKLKLMRNGETLHVQISCLGQPSFNARDSVTLRFLGVPEKDNSHYTDFTVYASGKTLSQQSFTATATRQENNWVAHLEIPLQNASGNKKSSSVWGFNLRRIIRAREATPKQLIYLQGHDISQLAPLHIGPNQTHFSMVPVTTAPVPTVAQPQGHLFLNRDKRMLAIDGKPCIPFVLSYSNIYHGTPQALSMAEDIKSAGFDTVYLWNVGEKSPLNKKHYSLVQQVRDIRMLGKKGLYVIPQLSYGCSSRKSWAASEFPLDELRDSHVISQKLLKDLPNVIAWATCDEIYQWWEQGKYPKKEFEVGRLTQLLRQHDSRPVMGNVFYNGRAYGGVRNFDILSCTAYTIRTTRGVLTFHQMLCALANYVKTFGSPTLTGIWIQYYNGSGEGGSREPTPQELSAMIYSGLIRGFRLFAFFQDRPNSTHLWVSSRQIFSDVRALSEILYYGSEISSTSNHSLVISSAHVHQGSLYLIAQNLSYSDVKGVSLATGENALNPVAQVMFENRALEVDHGTVTDSFKALERHVYRIPLVSQRP